MRQRNDLSGCVAPSEAGAGGPLNADTGPALEVGSPHYRELEAVLDALLNGIDRYRAELSPGDPVRLHLRDLVDMANAGRNRIGKS